jgi:hypothetical protein
LVLLFIRILAIDDGFNDLFSLRAAGWSTLCTKNPRLGNLQVIPVCIKLDRDLYTEDAMPRIRVIASAAIGCLFVCGLFGGLGVAQTASTEPVGKPMQLLHAGKSETKPTEGSAAKHSSKAHPVAKKRASTKPASKENTSIGAPQVTALPSELVIDGKAVRVASPDHANDIDLATDAQGALARDAATVVTAASTETIAPADESNSGAAAALSQTPSSSIGSMSWLLWIIAALSGAVATGSLAWFLIGPGASADVWISAK